MKKRTLALALIPVLCGTALSFGESEAPKGDVVKEKKAKVEMTVEQRFAKMDKDGDGVISFDEFGGAELEAKRKKMEGEEGADAKLAEREAKLKASFNKADQDADGTISATEYAASKAPVHREKKEKTEKAEKPEKVKKTEKAEEAETGE